VDSESWSGTAVRKVSAARYTSSALREAQRTFAMVTAEPTNLFLCGEDFGDELPTGRIGLPRLRDLLLRPSTSLPTRDAVWREVIGRAHADRSTWVVVALGMAMPGLRRCVRELKAVFTGDPADLESEIALGFVAALYAVDPAEWALCARLVRAAHKAGTRLVYAQAALDGARWEEYHSRAPVPPWGHPDFLLLGAVDAGVITDTEAKLIATTRLEKVPVGAVADLWGERTNTVVQRRRRAETRLAEALAEGTVTAVDIGARLTWVARVDDTRAGQVSTGRAGTKRSGAGRPSGGQPGTRRAGTAAAV
jgi:hypothetical protein